MTIWRKRLSLVSFPKASSADITALMAAFTGIRIKKIQTEDSIVTGIAHTIIPESVRDVSLTKADDGKVTAAFNDCGNG